MQTEHTIVLVEDEAGTRNMYEALLRGLGHTVIICKSGEELVSLHQSRADIDLAIVDVTMPGMGGVQAANLITEHRPIPVILLSATASSTFLKGAIENPYVIMPLVKQAIGKEQIQLAIEFCIARCQDNEKKDEELAELKYRRRASDILMKERGWNEDQAWRFIQKESRNRNLKAAKVAKIIIEGNELLSGD